MLVAHGLGLGDAVHDAGLNVGAPDLHGADLFVPLLLIDAPDLNHVAVVGEQECIGYPIHVAAGAAGDAFVLHGLFDPA